MSDSALSESSEGMLREAQAEDELAFKGRVILALKGHHDAQRAFLNFLRHAEEYLPPGLMHYAETFDDRFHRHYDQLRKLLLEREEFWDGLCTKMEVLLTEHLPDFASCEDEGQAGRTGDRDAVETLVEPSGVIDDWRQ